MCLRANKKAARNHEIVEKKAKHRYKTESACRFNVARVSPSKWGAKTRESKRRKNGSNFKVASSIRVNNGSETVTSEFANEYTIGDSDTKTAQFDRISTM